MTIDELRKLKKDLGYSNKRLSDESGVSLGTINKVFSGASANPRIGTIQQIAKTLLSSSHSSTSLLKEEVAVYKNSMHKPIKHTIQDYHALPDDQRTELFDGVFYDMSSPTVIHQRIIRSLCFQFEMFIRSNHGPCEVLPSPIDVQPDPDDDHTMLQPDILIVCDPNKITRKGIVGAPDFIAEIVSPSSIKMDYYRKAYKYETSGVREYWIIDPEKKTVLINRFHLNEPPLLLPLKGSVEVSIYDGKLLIDLDEIAACIW